MRAVLMGDATVAEWIINYAVMGIDASRVTCAVLMGDATVVDQMNNPAVIMGMHVSQVMCASAKSATLADILSNPVVMKVNASCIIRVILTESAAFCEEVKSV